MTIVPTKSAKKNCDKVTVNPYSKVWVFIMRITAAKVATIYAFKITNNE